MIYFAAGVALGIFVPAPYDALAKSWMAKGWGWIKEKTSSYLST